MLRPFKYLAIFFGSLLIVAIGTPLLALLGRSSALAPREMLVDDELLEDDPGVDVDGEGQA